MEFVIGQPLSLAFTSLNLVTGLTTFTSVVLVNGVALSPQPTVTYSEVGGGFYNLSFTPTQTGTYQVLIQGQVIRFSCVTTLSQSFLQTIEDSTLGSWNWNKSTGVLTLYTSTGTTLATYNVADSVSTASRARVS